MKHFVNESSDMGFSLEVFTLGGVLNEYQRPTKKEKRAAAGKATVSGRKKAVQTAKTWIIGFALKL